jgi:spore coat polysaccharide biosynthesis protein SpsF (cytidylyltransferase family)
MIKNIVKVSIGIQARSTSERLPKKILADICGKPMLEWVIDACNSSAFYLNNPKKHMQYRVNVFLLMPFNDEAIPYFSKNNRVLEGDEFDVLSRYYNLAKQDDCDYLVRVTGDCPLIPDAIISKTINTAVYNKYDYITNAYDIKRLAFDGQDVEVMSRKMINFLNEHASEKSEREHVTTYVRTGKCTKEMKLGVIAPYLNLSAIKLSVDTEEDLERVREQVRDVKNAIDLYNSIFHKSNVHRF